MFFLPKMDHNCSIKTKQGSMPELFITGNFFQKLKARLRTIVLVSPDNPRASRYYRSERALRDEKQRQLNLKYPWVIHPLSKLRAWYEIYLIMFYTGCLLIKPIDSGFSSKKEFFPGYRVIHMSMDALCWLDIIVNFCTGFSCIRQRKNELRLGKIAKNYMRSPYFVCDVLSAVPRSIPLIFFHEYRVFLGIVPVFQLFKFIRLFSIMELINNTAQYFKIRGRGIVFIVTATLVTFLVVHWLSCMQFLIPVLIGKYFTNPENLESWIFTEGIDDKPLKTKYTHSFFKGSAEILGVRLRMYEISSKQDYLVSILTFIIGRILLAALWIILAMTYLNARSMQLKFIEIINQLDEYMTQKNLPFNLRKRIIDYYDFKFQRNYFRDASMNNMLSSRLEREINVHICRSLISAVPLFANLTADEIGIIVTKLIPEIFLSKDTVIYSGTTNDTLYFISSGTVAIYTHSGREICHLQDGAYFGEMCLVVKNHLSQITVVAIEITHIYKLKRQDFDRCFRSHKDIYQKTVKKAHSSMKMIMEMEYEYRNKKIKKDMQRTENIADEDGMLTS